MKKLDEKTDTKSLYSLENLKAAMALCFHLNAFDLEARVHSSITPKVLKSPLTGQMSEVDILLLNTVRFIYSFLKYILLVDTLGLNNFKTTDARAAVSSWCSTQGIDVDKL